VATIFPEKRDRPGLAGKRADRPRVFQEPKVIFLWMISKSTNRATLGGFIRYNIPQMRISVRPKATTEFVAPKPAPEFKFCVFLRRIAVHVAAFDGLDCEVSRPIMRPPARGTDAEMPCTLPGNHRTMVRASGSALTSAFFRIYADWISLEGSLAAVECSNAFEMEEIHNRPR
jgi:hypothetical protein